MYCIEHLLRLKKCDSELWIAAGLSQLFFTHWRPVPAKFHSLRTLFMAFDDGCNHICVCVCVIERVRERDLYLRRRMWNERSPSGTHWDKKELRGNGIAEYIKKKKGISPQEVLYTHLWGLKRLTDLPSETKQQGYAHTDRLKAVWKLCMLPRWIPNNNNNNNNQTVLSFNKGTVCRNEDRQKTAPTNQLRLAVHSDLF